MSRERACRVCGCTELRACMTEAGPCAWVPGQGDLCTACTPSLEHVVSMQRTSTALVAVCRKRECGWLCEAFLGSTLEHAHKQRDESVRQHWRIVCEAARAA